jgi:hypothetical protein
MTSVRVVTPCYNYGHFLEEALSRVLDDQPGSIFGPSSSTTPHPMTALM